MDDIVKRHNLQNFYYEVAAIVLKRHNTLPGIQKVLCCRGVVIF